MSASPTTERAQQAALPETSAEAGANDIHHSLGTLTRQLHDALTALGLAERLKGLAGELPDAQSRLSYISRLTGEAADKVLTEVDAARLQQDQVLAHSRQLRELIAAPDCPQPLRAQAATCLGGIESGVQQVQGHLTEIMMAQGFHDLTGQVIRKVAALASDMEQQLVQMLLQTAPAEALPRAASGDAGKSAGLAGPVIDPRGNPQVVANQSEVDDLLASLGF
ncbi:MAG: protein phosphatase CheZ [Rhodoferax sp.]|nr:protein phosphatase CheZ [Rhodoferax sp.]